jgi:soluble lytic murein transglycosylase-like protein
VGLGISAFALMAFGFSRALCAVLRQLAGREQRHLLKAALLCIGLIASAANAAPLAPDANAQPQPTPLTKSAGPPVLGEAENATTDATSPIAEDSSPSSTAAPSITINPKSAKSDQKSDQNCLALAKAAAAHDLPLDFFVRLIRQESSFNPNSVSHAGAQGIAQFMPGTARWRGLADPFEPLQALYESARWLRELREQFGNLGLAAAAYNAGPRRVQDWLAGRGGLPGETRAYVRIITGRAAEEWARGLAEDRVDPQQWLTCTELTRAASLALPRKAASVETKTDWGPWGLQLAGNWSEAKALSDYKQLQKRFSSVLSDRAPMIIRSRMLGHGAAPWYLIRVAESTRDRAKQLCSRLESAGGSCLVYRN